MPQFTTEIDGVDIHFIHVKSRHENALPLIMTHGWPGSVIELLDTIGPLTDPTSHGGRAEDAFDLVLPSLPGYGFSSEPTELGWDAARTGRAWAELMHRLGYTRYVAQGGDVGALVTDLMGRQAVEGLAGYHLSLLTAVLAVGDHLPRESEQERAAANAVATFRQDGFGYFLEMATRPQTIGYALLDSPVALAAWLLDHDTDSYYKIASAFVDGKPAGNLTRDNIVDNITRVLADRHRPFGGPVVLGGRTSAGRSACERPASSGGHRAGRLHHVPRRDLGFPAQLGRGGLPRPRLLQRGRPRAATSPPGKSRGCSPTSCAQRSGRYVTRGAVVSTAVATPTEIRPFHVDITDDALDDLRRRIADTNWPEQETVADQSQGVPLAMMQKLARYWMTDYDWRTVEATLNALPQYITEIDGLDIHFIHVRSQHEGALPLVVNHGWPGSIIEQLKIIDRLTDPTAHGASPADAFHVVIPSMPGYGFSGKPTSTGWGPERMGRAWAELMERLGYTRYVAQGGDWGAFVVDQMGLQAPDGLLAIHTNMPATVPADVDKASLAGAPPPAGLSADERRAYEQLLRTYAQVEYARMMAARPQTLYGIADSPVGLAAWLLDHNDADGQPAAAVVAALDRTTSDTGELTRDEVLDNITLYWLTNTGVSASRLYWEYKGGFFNAKGVSIPVAVSVFPGEQYQAPRSWAEQAYPNLIYFNEVDAGGHFAAWEQPELFCREIRAAFRALR